MKKILPEIVSSIRYQVVSNNFVKYKIRNTKYPKKVLAVFLILIIFSGVAMKFWTKEASAAWFDDNYAYRTAITFTNAGAAVTDQKVKFDIDTATLISAGKMQSDCGDSRFTDANGKVLRYYLDTSGGACNGASTDYYVLLPTIPAGSNIVYHYYGNPSVSNGTEAAQFSNTTFTQTPATASEEKAPGPIMYWRFDDVTGTTAQDATNSNLDGTLNNTPVWQKDGCVSQGCLYFGGTTNQNVSKSDDSKLDFAASDSFTVSAWVRRNGASSANNFILTKAQAGYTGYKLYQDASGDYCFDVRDGTNTDSACTSAVEYDDDKWHLVQGVKIGTTSVTLFVDGKKVAQDSSIAATNTLANTGTFYAGVDLDGTSNEWLGFIDEVKVYQYARSAAQIAADYNAVTSEGGNVLGSNSQDFLNEGLAGYWKLDETASPAVDSSGSGNSGTWNGNAAAAVGKYGNSVALDGTSDYVLIGDQLDMADSDAITVSAWVYRTAVSQDSDIISKMTSSAGDGYHLIQYSSANGGNTCFNVQDNSGNRYETCTADNTTTSLNGWVHVVAVFDNKGKEGSSIYLNGVDAEHAVYEVGNPGILGNTSNSVTLCLGTEGAGGGVCSTQREFAGRIDDVRIYRRSLSPTEVQTLYNWAPGPVAYWNMEEGSGTTISDKSGNSNTSSSFTGNTAFTTGKFGKALTFDGTNDVVRIPETTTTDLGVATDSYSVSAWIKTTQQVSSSTYSVIVTKHDATGNYPFTLAMNENELPFCDVSEAGVDYISITGNAGSDVDDGQWHYVSCVLDRGSNTLNLYRDGVPVATPVSASSINLTSANNDDVSIGNGHASYVQYDFQGLIDEVKIYKYARSPKQIIEDMNGGHPAGGSPVGSQVAYWKLNEGYGTTANDSVSQNGSENLSFSGSTASWTNLGKVGKAWNGTGSVWLSLADDNDLDFASSEDLSVSMWVKSDSASNPAANQFLVAKQAATNNPGYRMYFNTSGQIVCDIDDDTTSYPEDSATTTATADLYDTNWHHIVCSRNIVSDHLDLFVDGKLAAQDTDLSATGSLANATTFYIGDDDGDATNSFAGDIDEVKVYRSALSDSEIKIDMNQNASQVLGSAGNKANTSPSAASQEYCTPGDTSCDIPILHWTFEEKIGSVADRSGTGNNGTFANNPTLSLGKYGGGVSFASNQYIAVADNTTFDFGTGSFTLETWAKPNHTDMNSYLISQTNGSTQGFGFRICGSSSCGASGQNLIGFVVGGGGANYRMEYSSEDVVDGNWHHYAVVFDAPNDDVRLYVDGRQLSSTSDNLSTWPNVNNANDFRISGDTTSYLPGSMDETKVFNYARSAAQVAWSYNKGLPVAHWKFDECSGTTAGDSSGNRNTGTWSGSSGTNATVGDCTTNAATARYNGRQGKMNYSLNFDGTDDVVRAAETTSTDLGLTSHSYALAAWIKTSTNFSTDALIIAKDDSGSAPYPYRLYLNSSEQACFDLREGSNTPSICGAIALNDGNWHHIVGIRDVPNDVLRLYVDGKVAATAVNDTTTATTANNDDVSLGNGGTSYTTLDFTGQIDDARIYNYPLTATQVVGVMNGGAVRFAPVTGAP